MIRQYWHNFSSENVELGTVSIKTTNSIEKLEWVKDFGFGPFDTLAECKRSLRDRYTKQIEWLKYWKKQVNKIEIEVEELN